MDKLSLITAGLLVLVVVITYLAVAFRSLRTMRSIDDFFIFNRRLRYTSVFSTTFSAEMSLATVFIAFMTLAAFLGLNLILAMLTFVAGQGLLWIVIPRIKQQVMWGETLQTFLGVSYNSARLRQVASLTSVVGFAGLFATEILVGSGIFTYLIGDPGSHLAVVATISSLVIFYTTLGGFKSVVATDRWQAVGVFFVIAVLLYAAFTLGGAEGRPLIPQRFIDDYKFDIILLLNFFIINTLYPICDMSAWQRIAAARDETVARRGFKMALISFFVTWSILIFAALALADYTAHAAGAGALIEPLRGLAGTGLAGTIIVGLALAALAAAMLSTGDTFLIAAVQSLSIDILYPRYFAARREAEQAQFQKAEAEAEVNTPNEPLHVRGAAYAPRIFDEDYDGVSAQKVLFAARGSIVIIAIAAICFFGLLQAIGFAVADFVFVVYGSTVAFLPVILGAFLIRSTDVKQRMGRAAIMTLFAGLIAGWAYGIASVLSVAPELPLLGPGNAYNSPTIALLVAMTVYLAGLAIAWRQTK